MSNFEPESFTFFELLPAAVVESIKSRASLKSYNDGRLIHNRGSTSPGLSIIESGAVLAGIYGADGSFVVTSILGPGQIYGQLTLFTDIPRSHDMSASGPTRVYHLSEEEFQYLNKSEPAIAQALLKISLIRMHLVLELLDAHRRLPLLERTAKIILLMAHSSGQEENLKCRQSDLAFALGVSRVSLTKSLKQLREKQFIETRYGEIKIINSSEMKRWANAKSNTNLAE